MNYKDPRYASNSEIAEALGRLNEDPFTASGRDYDLAVEYQRRLRTGDRPIAAEPEKPLIESLAHLIPKSNVVLKRRKIT